MASPAATAASVLAIIAALVAVLYARFVHIPWSIYRRLRAQGLPGTSYIPLIGHIREVIVHFRAGRSIQLMMDHYHRHGTVWVHSIGPHVELKINDPAYLPDILRNKAHHYQKSYLAQLFLATILGRHNLLLEEGDEHALHRRMISPSFRHENLVDMVGLMARDAKMHVSQWLSRLRAESESDSGNEVELELHRALSAMTLDVIASCAFGEGLRSIPDASSIIYNAFESAVIAGQWRFHRLIPFMPIIKDLPILKKPMVDKAHTDLQSLVEFVIKERREGRNSSSRQGKLDLLDLLIDATNEDTSEKFTDEQVRDEAMTFVLAGHETTSQALTWTLYVLMTNQPLWDECVAEINTVCGANATPTAEQLGKLKLVEAVLLESMRLWPPAPIITRDCVADHMLTGKGRPDIHVPRGTLIHISFAVIHRLKEYWGEHADQFDHTRWLQPVRPNAKSAYQYLPFSAGTRNCIGQNFALLEAKCLLAIILQSCRMTFCEGQKLVDGMPMQTIAITLRPRYGVRVKLSQRVL